MATWPVPVKLQSLAVCESKSRSDRKVDASWVLRQTFPALNVTSFEVTITTHGGTEAQRQESKDSSVSQCLSVSYSASRRVASGISEVFSCGVFRPACGVSRATSLRQRCLGDVRSQQFRRVCRCPVIHRCESIPEPARARLVGGGQPSSEALREDQVSSLHDVVENRRVRTRMSGSPHTPDIGVARPLLFRGDRSGTVTGAPLEARIRFAPSPGSFHAPRRAVVPKQVHRACPHQARTKVARETRGHGPTRCQRCHC